MDGGASISGFSREGLAKIGPALQGVVDNGFLSGAVTLVWRNGEIADVTCVGQRDLSTGAPMTRDTLFRIASMTKPVTSAVIMMLMEEGKLRLDDPITKWAPEFSDMKVLKDAEGPLDQTYPAPRDITIEDLLTHRSGLAYGFTSMGPIAQAYQEALGDVLNTGQHPDAWMEALAGLPLSYAPGERFHYSHATDVLGFIAGRIEGKGIREVLFERVFDPLGMVDTDFYIPPEKRDRAAVVYRIDEATSSLQPVRFAQYDAPPPFCGGGGGLISTADDYLKFALALLGDGEHQGVRLLSPQSVALMRTNRLSDAQREIPFMGIPFWGGQGFGLGLSVITDAEKQAWMGVGTNGAFSWPGAFGTWWRADPAENMVMLYLIQNSMPLEPGSASQLATGQRLAAAAALPMFQNLVYTALGR
ncbi:serine hydrolase domain-containing protein [Phenylobacterium montanum]|uniref:Beta-lactamase family protein n=1 Tax=Phenylobacterium montanum TaxID=2823693 RepID=A0A975IXY8_9CAUL|nr:serine hydrolase domain-containing protein [Caulobacter sp. S6]QUD89911.1 beta-lactamase family protein [Caulobacter sp. S6]